MNLNNKKVGITGSTGVLGKRLITFLIDAGCSITCLVRDPSKVSIMPNNNIAIRQGDLNDMQSLKEFVAGQDIIIHLAAHVDHGAWQDYYIANVLGNKNLCQAIKESSPDCHLVYCSSIAVLRLHKFFTLFNTDYAKSKKLGEKIITNYEKQGLSISYVYPGVIYGPEDNKLLPALVKYLRQKRLFFLTGGEQYAPLIYIDDLCDLLMHACDGGRNQGKRYIGVGPQEMGIHDFIRLLAIKTQQPVPSIMLPKYLLMPIATFCEFLYKLFNIKKQPLLSKRAVDLLSINLDKDIVAAYNGSDWQPKTYISDGLESALVWCHEHELI